MDINTYVIHAKMHARLDEFLDRSRIIDTSLNNLVAGYDDDVQLNYSRIAVASSNTGTTTTAEAVHAAAYNKYLYQLKRLDNSDKDRKTNNTTTPTKNHEQLLLVQRMKAIPYTRRKSSSTAPTAA